MDSFIHIIAFTKFEKMSPDPFDMHVVQFSIILKQIRQLRNYFNKVPP
jgi:hypothetical protein